MATTTIDRLNGINSGVAIKAPVRAATTAAITLSGEQTVDGIALVAGDRVLVKDQASAINNGIYEVATSSWSRTPDFDGSNDVVTGTVVFVNLGTTNGSTLWNVTSAGTLIPGTSSIAFELATAVNGDQFFAINGASGSGNLSYSFTLDDDTGFYRSAANEIRVQTGGSDRVTIDSTGAVLVGHTSALPSIGGTASTPTFQNAQLAGAAYNAYARFDNGAAGIVHRYLKSRSASIGGYSIVSSGDSIITWQACADDGVDYQSIAATIAIAVDGTPGSNDMPGRIVFSTTADGAASVTERMRIDSAGNVGIGTTANANAILHVASTTKQSIPMPVMTTAQKNALTAVNGGQVFDDDLNRPAWYNGSAWEYSVFGKRFTSSDQTVSSAGLLTVAHGLGVTPFLVKVWLKCLTAELNYTIGDLVEAPSASSSAGTDNQGFALKRDATNVYVRFGSNANPLRLPDWTTGASTTLTNANWALVIEAFA